MRFSNRTLLLLLFLFLICLRMYTFCHGNLIECVDSTPDAKYHISLPFDRILDLIRIKAVHVTRRHLPSPHSELLLGMTIGINDLKKIPSFNNALKDTGTIHVVVVSGYNISLVFGLVISLIGSQKLIRNLLVAQVVTLFYALLSGFDPPVVRSWVMGSVIAWGKYYSRGLDVLLVLFFSGFLMIFIDPLFLFNLSFQLSFLATLGLISYSNLFERVFRSFFSRRYTIIDDLVATLSAQVLVWPLISYRFSRVSILSPLVNALILWTVPLATLLGGLFLLGAFISDVFGRLFGVLVYVPLDIFVIVIEAFSNLSFAAIDFKLSLSALCIYYFVVILVSLSYRVKS